MASGALTRCLGPLGLLAFSCLIAAVVGELAVRLVLPPIGRHHQLLVEHDELLGWRKVPNAVARIRTDEYDVLEKLNSKGLRDSEHAYEKGDSYRVLVLGDSFVEGYTVPDDNLLTTVLEEQLSRSLRQEVEVINGGTGGYSTDQQLLFFTSEGKKYAPDVTVLMFHDNDLWYNAQPRYWRGNKPLFVFSNDATLELTNVPVPKSQLDNGESDRGVKGVLGRYSQLYVYLREGLKQNLAVHRFFVRLGLMKQPRDGAPSTRSDVMSLIPTEFHAYSKEALDEPVTLAWKTTEAILKKLESETSAINSELLVFHVPPNFAVDPERRDTFWTQYGGLLDPERINRDLEEACRRQGLDFTNPLRRMQREHATREPLYFEKDPHWNAAGHELASQLIADEIRARYAP